MDGSKILRRYVRGEIKEQRKYRDKREGQNPQGKKTERFGRRRERRQTGAAELYCATGTYFLFFYIFNCLLYFIKIKIKRVTTRKWNIHIL